ncbi:MAG TPA: hypothetical protein VKV29_10745 [Chthonomonas sp.]|uniref:hypothetical protein n=1 Tax=Chthonomonas sp. TaxID=2282153 RepID=UPI002B4ADB61|nr:hypothetical protein [Chthonomonas sp.]HLH80744.1 hypothetical protein [Chthonomonas sp.]
MRAAVTRVVALMGLLALLTVMLAAQAQTYRSTKFQHDLRQAQTHLAAMQRLLNRVAEHRSLPKKARHATRPSHHAARTKQHKGSSRKKH